LKSTTSLDINYNNIDPEDVAIQGITLDLMTPNQSLNLISGLETVIKPNITYTGNENLSYSLIEKPSSMTIDISSGIIKWTPSISMENSTHDIKIKVTDGILFSEASFSLKVLKTNPLGVSKEEKKITVTEEGSLKGLAVTLIDDNLNISNITLKKLPSDSFSDLPSNVSKITDFFMIETPVKGSLKVKLPLSELPKSVDLTKVNLYSLTEVYGVEGKFWSPVGINTSINLDDSSVEITLAGLSGAFFVGYSNDSVSTRVNPLQRHTINSRNYFTPRYNQGNITCTPSPTYINQLCTVSTNSNVKIRVLNFGTASNSTRWNGATVKDLISWLMDSQNGFDNLDMDYENDFTVSLHTMANPYILGYVMGGSENYKTLHLNSSNIWSKSTMQGTTAHEYFHHAQSKTTMSGRNHVFGISEDNLWLIEGTARWFEDYLFDDLNTYTKEYRGEKILQAGLTSESGEWEKRPYQRFSFFKLLNSKCSNFENIYKEILNVEGSFNKSAIENMKNQLTQNGNCNFGNHLGSSKANSIDSALLYFQYGTVFKNKMSLLDSNELDTTLRFASTDYKYTSYPNENVIQIHKIPAYGAYSIQIDVDSSTLPPGKEAVLKVKTGSGAKPLTVSIVSEDDSFIGTTLLYGNQHIHYKTDEKAEHLLTSSDLNSLFITLLNPNKEDVELSKVSIEIRDNALVEPVVTSHSEGSDVNKRVIEVAGTIPNGISKGIDSVIISNGDIKTYTKLKNDNSYSAGIIVTMGTNTLNVTGFNSSDLETPKTKEKVLNVNGIEDSSGARNALIPSRVAMVLRWNTDNTDVDVYSTDKNNQTIWYQNLAVAPGSLDYDDTDGFGPEVLSYKKTDDDVYTNGEFDVDVHYYRGDLPTNFTLDIVLNETETSSLRVRHYDSNQSLIQGNSAEHSPTGTGNSRFNDIVSINCNESKICFIGDINSSVLGN
ncbi:MAG: hypothetical protein OIF32_03175, partial [Campylobacterales bacterium]|nr:hypothetical protein [Campylobacterales bacterium]